jgi:hypothetical protein
MKERKKIKRDTTLAAALAGPGTGPHLPKAREIHRCSPKTP